LQSLFSLKGGTAVTGLHSTVQPVHPITDSNQPELQLPKGHVLIGHSDGSANLGALGNVMWACANPGNSGRVVVLNVIQVQCSVQSTAADVCSVWFDTIHIGPSTTLAKFNQCDSRVVGLLSALNVFESTSVAVGGIPNYQTVQYQYSTVIPALTLVNFTAVCPFPIVLFPNSYITVQCEKIASVFLASSYATLTLAGYERTFEPTENLVNLGVSL
jgi:hypothetical protein